MNLSYLFARTRRMHCKGPYVDLSILPIQHAMVFTLNTLRMLTFTSRPRLILERLLAGDK